MGGELNDVLSPDLLKRLDISEAVRTELTAPNRLLPKRKDHQLLATEPARVEKWLRPRIRRGTVTEPADVIFADKGWRGTRPLNIMALEHRVLYRALVDALAVALPNHLTQRAPFDEFQRAALDVVGAAYVSKTDVASYYVYIDHDLLADELIAQTGDELAVSSLRDLLAVVMDRRVGLPQVHQASRILGDTYIDPVRRRLRRRGIAAFTYSDDFRIASPSLGSARSALAECEAEIRKLGLVLNDRKTYTYAKDNYATSLGAYSRAEKDLFSEGDLTPAEAFLFQDDYSDDSSETETSSDGPQSLGAMPIDGPVDDDEVTEHAAPVPEGEDGADQRAAAARKAWQIWVLEEETEEAQSSLDATITQSLLSRALPTLGDAQNADPLNSLKALLSFEPGLAPQISAYLVNYCAHGPKERANVRSAIDDLLEQDLTNPWQGMWIAHALGYVRRQREPGNRVHLEWLAQCVEEGPDGLAATAAATLGQLQYGDPELVAAAVDRLGPEWRQLALWGLHKLAPEKADESADNELDRIMIEISKS